MQKTSGTDQRTRTQQAMAARGFRFEQGSSLHVGLLAMIERASGPGDEQPFVAGRSVANTTFCDIDLRQIHEDTGLEAPPLQAWLTKTSTALDLSAAFAGVPADALAGSGIPSAVVDGPVETRRTGDAAEGTAALLTQMCGGKLMIDPVALLGLIAVDGVEAFAQRDDDSFLPLRSFHAHMSVADYLRAVGLTPTTLINQIMTLGYDLRSVPDIDVVDQFESHLSMARAELAWFIDEQDLVHTAQVVISLTDFFTALFSSEAMIEHFASVEDHPTEEVRSFVQAAGEAGRLSYINATWQTLQFDDDIEPIEWPTTVDISDSVAIQAQRLRDGASN